MTSLKPDCTIAQHWVVSSEEERFLDAEEVTGSIPVPPTINSYLKGDVVYMTSPFLYVLQASFDSQYTVDENSSIIYSEKVIAMLMGIGIDLCKISRMEKVIQNSHFVQRVFHPVEIDYASSKLFPAQHYAASFAAREAFAKASGLGLSRIIFQGVWVKRTPQGPLMQLSDKVKDLLSANDPLRVHVSISHEGGLSAAFVVLEVLQNGFLRSSNNQKS